MGREFFAEALDRDTWTSSTGKKYELRNGQEFGIVDSHRLEQMLAKVLDARNRNVATEKDAEQAAADVHELAGMLLVGGADELSDYECVEVAGVWMVARAQRLAAGDGLDQLNDEQLNEKAAELKVDVAAAHRAGLVAAVREAQNRRPPTKHRGGSGSSRGSKRSTAASRKRGSARRSTS